MRSPFAERFSNASHHPRCLADDSDIQDVNLADQTLLLGRSRVDQEGVSVVRYLGEPTGSWRGRS